MFYRKSQNINDVTMTSVQPSKSDIYGDTVIQQFRSLREKDELCDFQVSAEGRTFKVWNEKYTKWILQ